METTEILTELGKTILQCRDVPRNVFDKYGAEVVDKDALLFGSVPIRTFHKISEHPEGSYCLKEAEKEDYRILAMLLTRDHDYTKTLFDKKPILKSSYIFWRTRIGCVGESIKRATCSSMTNMEDIYSGIFGNEIIEIGLNEHYNPQIDKRNEKNAMIIGEASSQMKINPALPQEDANELLNRFKGLFQYYRENKETN